MAMVAPVYYTADMVRALPDDGNRYEVVHGELLVTPSPRLLHQEVLGRLGVALWQYLETKSIGRVYFSPADISWGPDMLVQPDIFVVPLEEARTMDWAQLKHLRLVVEILSPGTARYDRFTKRLEYQRQGVPLYWIVDADRRHVEVWTPNDTFPHTESDRLRWCPEGTTEPFELSLEDLFRPI